jgi:predicted PurR-regulated permease PerM
MDVAIFSKPEGDESNPKVVKLLLYHVFKKLLLVLALFAGLACFLPYLGPIIGAIPIILVAGGESLNLALWALGLYCCVQFLESYLLTPLIQARAVSMPPAAVILNQLVFGALFGLLGLALATPLAAAATVPLRHVFGQDEDVKKDGA